MTSLILHRGSCKCLVNCAQTKLTLQANASYQIPMQTLLNWLWVNASRPMKASKLGLLMKYILTVKSMKSLMTMNSWRD